MQIIGVDGSARDYSLKRGDTGPGGGVIIYVAPTTQSWGRYIEMSRLGYTPSKNYSDAAYLSTFSGNREIADGGSAIGRGTQNQANVIAQGSTNCIFNFAASTTAGGKTDWVVPTTGDITAGGVFTAMMVSALGLTESYHASSTEHNTVNNKFLPVFIGTASAVTENTKDTLSGYRVRLVRYF